MTLSMAWRKHYADGSGRRLWPNTELAAFVSGQSFQRVLEAGCGVGANLRLWDQGVAVGVDAYLPVLQEASAFWHRPVACADILALPFLDSAFDLVVDCLTSQHVRWAKHLPLYREFRRVLAPGGRLWVCHLDADSISDMQRVDFNEYAHVGLFPSVPLVCLPQARELKTMVMRAGFRVDAMRWWARGYPDQDVAHYALIEATAA